MSKDIFDQTVATYCDEHGAGAFVAKERKNAEARRKTVYGLLEGIDLASARVLDVGCGFGRDVAVFREQGAEAFGCDVSPALLAQAEREVGPYFTLFNIRDWTPLPFGGGFGVVWCCAVLVHLPRTELSMFLKTVWESLNEGGVAVITSKQGTGEEVSCNLGDDLPRVMVFYEPEEVVEVWRALGGTAVKRVPHMNVTAFNEALFGVVLRK